MEPQRKRARLDLQQQSQHAKQGPLAADPGPLKDVLGGGNTHSLFDLLDRHPIRDRLMQFLDTKDVLRLCQASKALKADILANEWNVNKRLQRFFKDPVAFRSQLGQNNALIYGHWAWQFLARRTHVGPLSIVVQAGKDARSLVEYLMNEGYETGPIITPVSETKKSSIYKYAQGRNEILVLIATSIPIQALLVTCQTTAHANFISWNKVFCLFPRPTLLNRETIPLKPMDYSEGQLHRKLSLLGLRLRVPGLVPCWEVENLTFESLPHETARICPDVDALGTPVGRTSKVHRITRRIADQNTWVLPLDTSSVKRPSVPDFVLEYSGFSIVNTAYDTNYEPKEATWDDFSESACYEIEAPLFPPHNSLRYSYTHGYMNVWYKFRDHLDRHTLAQLWMLPESKRQALIGNKYPSELRPGRLEFDHPKGWTYLDEAIPRYFKKWQNDERDSDSDSDDRA